MEIAHGFVTFVVGAGDRSRCQCAGPEPRAGQGVLSPLPTRPCPLVDPVRYAPLDHDAYILAIHAAWRNRKCYVIGLVFPG